MTAGICGKIRAPYNCARPTDSGLVSQQSIWFPAVAYLADLAQSLRRKGIELEEKRRVARTPDFTEDIIHSMRGGLVTTDLRAGLCSSIAPEKKFSAAASLISGGESCPKSMKIFGFQV